MPKAEPLFIHSLFRSSSTYLFDRFRRLGPQFTCYQEPFHEALIALNEPQWYDRLLEPPLDAGLRHPPLSRPYFYEFWLHRVRLAGLFREPFSYREYFLDASDRLPQAQIDYLHALLQAAADRAVLQFCRSSGRIEALRRAFGGLHVHLWREPRVQWWSYKVADYMEQANRRIYGARHLPASLRRVGRQAGVWDPAATRLDAASSYRCFYGLWLDAWLRLQRHADVSISVDLAHAGSSQNALSARALSERLGCPIDLSDLHSPGMQFAASEEAFYAALEADVQAAFLATGAAAPHELEQARAAQRAAGEVHEAQPHDPIAERNLRQSALAMMDQMARASRTGPIRRLIGWRPRRLRAAWHSWARRQRAAARRALGGGAHRDSKTGTTRSTRYGAPFS